MNPIDYWYQRYLKEKLTWKDIEMIVRIIFDVRIEMRTFDLTGEDYCKEVLRRFNEQREKK